MPARLDGRRRLRSGWALAALSPVLFVGVAAAQEEMDRQDLPERNDSSGQPVPDQGARGDPRFIPEPVPDLDGLEPPPPPPPPPGEDEPSLWSAIKLKHRGWVRAGAGHDTNVFRSERSRTADGFGRAEGELELLATFPQGGQAFVEVGGEALAYFERDRANERFGSAFVELFQPLRAWLDVGVQNAFEYSRQNLLDDNGDLFPRGRFGSADEEVRAYAIGRPGSDLALEAGASYRWKDYEENRGVDSLDYEELRLDGSISWKIAQRPRTRVKLKYRFRRRDYREFRARDRDGAIGPTEPVLDLHRHQLNLTFFQDLRLGGQELRVVLGLGAAYNRDLHANDRSYREGAASAQLEWWPVPQREDAGWGTKLELSVRGVARDFLVRHPPSDGGHLRHRLLDVTVGVWQRVGDLPVAAYAEATATHWRSGDPLEGYERFVLEAGVEVFW